MEKMNYGTLQDLFGKDRLTDEQAAKIMEDIFEGLAYIHQKNYIHRDMKPENILINRRKIEPEEDLPDNGEDIPP